jgi:hypothetical protein
MLLTPRFLTFFRATGAKFAKEAFLNRRARKQTERGQPREQEYASYEYERETRRSAAVSVHFLALLRVRRATSARSLLPP